ncbi:hypothetical protein [Marinitenerispora sediminis]|uniref:Uncharacterized protein n=1 Tax=Marinitenerispora sediminis TaxID=1931232 RepID=A0A368T843_9ACTN|nr:hypothetical protein [Marinitenerispora sediminis]RCV51363.1 hypothetical protein DEF28_15680 [Marinitenerispora sediminis]RCV57191.1 hypothetical protein DEF23_11255 [Marinitenerispora sediminis]RCV60302.1 hypothetical protein DEF24_07445 [Marinitenerispora sediminis]
MIPTLLEFLQPLLSAFQANLPLIVPTSVVIGSIATYTYRRVSISTALWERQNQREEELVAHQTNALENLKQRAQPYRNARAEAGKYADMVQMHADALGERSHAIQNARLLTGGSALLQQARAANERRQDPRLLPRILQSVRDRATAARAAVDAGRDTPASEQRRRRGGSASRRSR